MSKQAYLISVLDALPEREMGRGIRTLLTNNQLNEETLDKMVVMFKRTMDQMMSYIKDKQLLEKIQTSEKLIQKQQLQSVKDSKDLEKLDALLNTF